MHDHPYTYVWAFEVPPAHDAEFRRHYGPEGSWVALFRQHPGHVETLLLADQVQAGRYLTVDRWQSLQAYEEFRARFGDAYAALDAICNGLTRQEIELGRCTELR